MSFIATNDDQERCRLARDFVNARLKAAGCPPFKTMADFIRGSMALHVLLLRTNTAIVDGNLFREMCEELGRDPVESCDPIPDSAAYAAIVH